MDGATSAPQPNYLIRRAIAVGVVVAVVAVGAIVVGRMIDGDGGDGGDLDVDTSWNSIVTVDERTGRISISAADGSDMERFSSAVGSVNGATMIDDTIFVAGARGAAAIELSGDRERVEFELGDDATVGRPAGTLHTMMFTSGDDAVFVRSDVEQHIETSAVVDAPGVRLSLQDALANAAGTVVLVADVANFQSVLLRFDDDPVSYVAGAPIAVDDDRVATVQNVGTEARLMVSNHAGALVEEVSTQPVLAAMLVEDGVLTVDASGTIHRISDGEDEAIGMLGSAPVADASWVTTSGDRLVVTTAEGISVLDTEGDVIASPEAVEALPTGPPPVSTVPMRPGCLALHGSGSTTSLLDLRSGRAPAASAEGSGDRHLLTSADGCSALVADGAGHVLLTEDRTTTVGLDGDALAMSPDADSVIVDHDGRLWAAAVSGDDDRADGGETSATDPAPAGADADGDDLGTTTPFAFYADL